MTDDGLIATQAWQLIDVSAYSVDINAGLVTVDASALYNVPADILSGVSSLNIQFLDASHAAIGLGVNVGSSTLTNGFVDSNVATWESLNITSAPLPVGTQYLRTQLAYGNASMRSNGVSRPGYVDATHLTLTAVPEPSTLILAASAWLAPLLRRKRG